MEGSGQGSEGKAAAWPRGRVPLVHVRGFGAVGGLAIASNLHLCEPTEGPSVSALHQASRASSEGTGTRLEQVEVGSKVGLEEVVLQRRWRW